MAASIDFRVLVSVVNYRSAALVCRMLPDLIHQIDKSRDRIVIVDNQSPDDSFKILTDFVNKAGFIEYVDVVLAEKNGGFSYGNNLAIKTAINRYQKTPSFIWLLNPDTRVLDGALTNLVSFFDTSPKAGILGSRLESENGAPQESAFNFCSLASEFLASTSIGYLNRIFSKSLVSLNYIPDSPTLCDWVAGASMFIRYSVIENIGLMDETYFLYFEETDFCLQSVRAGWECWYVPSSRVIHYVGQSTGVIRGDALRRRRPKYWFQSRQYYFLKNHGLSYTMAADLIWGIGFGLLKIRYFVQRKKTNNPKNMLRDFWRNSIFLSWLDRKQDV
ncbi:glycosyltransferase family 2 protein [Methylophaga sp.]|uniref:glycosyltransferase family 2 protein n=1 Tax=Methylophaga sp. TaxID=2024840 RepID=UPI003A914A52